MQDMTKYADVWEALEDAREGHQATAALYHWSTNYDAGHGPFTLFLDMIGWSEENIGESLHPLARGEQASGTLGYKELDMLGDALKEYTNAPLDVRAFVDVLLELEGKE